jgi:sugar lactone lactonase YvrE/thiol-disulfide isomerase/thioredoxin
MQLEPLRRTATGHSRARTRFGSLLVAIFLAGFCIFLWLNPQPMDLGLQRQAMVKPGKGETANAPEFPPDLEWLNTDRSLRLKDLRGKVILLDFWTYCCINCMHVIPDLKRLERKYDEELVVIGVHSAKFTTEQETENIRQAILRYEIVHPVVNDSDMTIWQEYGVRAWPTLVLIDPAGKIAGRLSGEGVYNALDKAIAGLIEEFETRGELDRTPLDLKLERESAPAMFLAFPGKLLADAASRRLFIADSNHNRIVVVSLDDQSIRDIVGSGEAGLKDGGFEEAQFDHPQGMALDGSDLYLADTENHAIRRVDFDTRTVETVAGTGKQARRFNVAGPGKTTPLNSPWDLAIDGGGLYIAMAGSHQLWRMDLETREVAPYAGSGREARIDGPLRRAALAQPSGLATDGRKLYFADSEVSSIRSADLDPSGKVETIVGGDLFEFGDVDGVGLKARLQHPLGVAFNNGALYVADTYNNKIRRIALADQSIEAFLGTGEAGHEDGREATFDEPGGLSVADGKLYIADTNNHAIRVADLETRRVDTLQIRERAEPSTSEVSEADEEAAPLPAASVRPGKGVLTVAVDLPAGYKFNAEAPTRVVVHSADKAILSFAGGDEQSFKRPDFPLTIPVRTVAGGTEVRIELTLYYCEKEDANFCFFKEARLVLPVKVEAAAGSNELEVSYSVPDPRAP